MPDLVKMDTRIEARLLEVDRRLYLKAAYLELLRPVAPAGMEVTRTLATHWFIEVGSPTTDEDILIFKVPDLFGDLEEDLEGVEVVRMLDVDYKRQRIERPKPGKPRVYLIITSVKKFVKRNFKLPT
jgi:hypothetical protein